MKGVSRIAAGLLALGILACIGGKDDQTSSDQADQSVATTSALAEPWGSMNLPLGDGQILKADPHMLLVAWDQGGDKNMVHDDWKNAITAKGWAFQESYQNTDFIASIFKKNHDFVGLAIGNDAETNALYAYMEDLGDLEGGDVAQARQRIHPPRLARYNLRRQGHGVPATRNRPAVKGARRAPAVKRGRTAVKH